MYGLLECNCVGACEGYHDVMLCNSNSVKTDYVSGDFEMQPLLVTVVYSTWIAGTFLQLLIYLERCEFDN